VGVGQFPLSVVSCQLSVDGAAVVLSEAKDLRVSFQVPVASYHLPIALRLAAARMPYVK
jgi:hypothetical protein